MSSCVWASRFDTFVFGNWIQRAFIRAALKLQSNNFQLAYLIIVLWFIAEVPFTTANIWESDLREEVDLDPFTQ